MSPQVYSRILSITPDLADFTELVALHLNSVRCTKELEAEAIQLIEAGFPQLQLEDFIRGVHDWGRSYKYHLRDVLRRANSSIFEEVMKALNVIPPNFELALNCIMGLYGIGPSYGSKHLRFLRPDICPILDNKVWEKFKYRWDAKGYRVLCADVKIAAKILQEHKIPNPMDRPAGRWFAADVDMALFAHLNKSDWLSC